MAHFPLAYTALRSMLGINKRGPQMLNMTAFAAVTKSIRKEVEAGFNAETESIYSFYRWFVKDAAAAGKLASKEVDKAAELRSELTVAARTAQQFGATPAQINYIVALATARNDFNVLSGGRLTKTDASRIIDSMKH